MVARYRVRPKIEVDWRVDGAYSTDLADVTQWATLSLERGTQHLTNPRRPLVAPMDGTLTLSGERIRIARGFFISILSRLIPFRVTHAGATVGVGLLNSMDISDIHAGVVRFDVESYREQDYRRRRRVAQTASAIAANSASQLTRLAEVLGVDALEDTDQIPATPLTVYSFDGRAGRYLSDYALVTGTFPMERSDGAVGLYQYLNRQSPDLSLSFDRYIISGLRSDVATQHIINKAIVPFAEAAGTTQRFIQDWTVRTSATETDNGDSFILLRGRPGILSSTPMTLTATIVLPALPAGQTYDNIHISEFEPYGRVITEFTRFSNGGLKDVFFGNATDLDNPPTYTFTQVGSGPANGPQTWRMVATYDSDEQFPGVHRWSMVTPTGIVSRTARHVGLVNPTLNTINTGATWNGTDRQGGGFTPPGFTLWNINIDAAVGDIFNVGANFSVAYDIVNEAMPNDIIIEDAASVRSWRERTLEFPLWFAATATADVRARVDALKDVRNAHRITLPLWQRDEARSREIASIEPGDHVDLRLAEPIVSSEVRTGTIVMNVRDDLSNLEAPRRTLYLLETGPVPTGRARLTLGGNPLFLTGIDPRSNLQFRNPLYITD